MVGILGIIKQGDIIKIDFGEKPGHEQSGYRPAVVLSNDMSMRYQNGIVFLCPITSNVKKFPSHVILDERTKTQGAVLCEHCQAMDINSREYTYIEKIPADILDFVINVVFSCMQIPAIEMCNS
jgi:mRNA interferase MazF